MPDQPHFPDKPQFDFGRVMNSTFSAIWHNLLSFVALSLIFVGIPAFVIGLWPIFLDFNEAIMSDNTEALAQFMQFAIVSGLAGIAIMIVFQALLQGAVIRGCIKHFNNEKSSIGDGLRTALKYILPLIGFAILSGLGMMLGFILLIVPGVILALMWYVGVPAIVAEETGVMGAFERSSALTDGYKGWILLFIVLLFFISMIISAVGSAVLLAFGDDPVTQMVTGGTPTTAYWYVNAFINAAAQMFSSVMFTAGVAAVYYELRRLKDGVGAESLAAIFD